MTMMISKFHRLIQSRLLWGVFLVIIVFSFVIWGMVWPSQMKDMDQANAEGTLDGQPVPRGEFNAAYRSTYLSRALMLGREIASTPETDAILRQMSWQRLAALREAAKLGITASDQDLVQALRSNFAETNGVYNPQRYQAFLQNMIFPLRFTTAQFEQHVREEIMIQKLGLLIGRQAQVTPLEIRRTYDTLMDEFTVEYATISESAVAEDVNVTEADARKLYDADPAAFTLPEQCEVSYVSFPVADYADDQAEIADEDIQDYYELHIEDYTTEEADTNGAPRQKIADLDEVKPEIVKILRHQAALDKADEAATSLAFRAIPDRDGSVPDFAEEAKKAGRKARKLPPFSRRDLPVEDGGEAFAAAAFELEPGAFDRVSAPVAGNDHVYVIYLEKKIAPRVPSFEEAQDQVLATARNKAVANALSAKAQELKKAAEAGLAAGKSFADSVSGLGLKAETAEPFTGLSGASSTNVIIHSLVQSVVGYNPGEVTEPIASENGLMVAYLKGRTPADPASFDAYRNEIGSAIRARRGQGRFREWQAALLAPSRFTDLQRQATEAENLEEDAADDTGEDSNRPPADEIPPEDQQFL